KRAHLERIERQVGVADGVITALNNFAKLPVPQLQRVELLPFLNELVDLEALGDTVQVKITCPADDIAVRGDRDQLWIVFGNLLRNAREAMPAGGVVGIEVPDNGNGTIDVAVRDDGVGIAKEDVARIMEPLYSTKSRGIGLG